MSTIIIIILGLLVGVFFGFALEKSKVLDPETIVEQLQLKNFIMLRFFLSGIITGLIVYQVFDSLDMGTLNWKTLNLKQDLLGGALLGVGIAFAGACPGTVFGQIGVGYKDALVTFLGAFSGAISFIYIKPLVISSISPWPNEKIVIPNLLGLDFMTVRFIMIAIFIGFLLIIRRLPNNAN